MPVVIRGSRPLSWLAGLAFAAATLSGANAEERITQIAGGGTQGPGRKATQVRLEQPFGVDFDNAGNMYIVEMTGNRVLKVDGDGVLHHVAGTGEKGDAGDGGPAAAAQLNGPHALAIGPAGQVFVADTWNNRIRKIDPATGAIANFAGTGEKAFGGDGGPVEQAQFGGVYCIAFDPEFARMYVADLDNRRIRAIDMQSRIVTTVAGNGQKSAPQDAAIAVEAPLVDPRAVAADRSGNVYILERSGHALRVVGRDRKIRTVAGTGSKGHSGDGGEALKAQMNGPKHLSVADDDSVLIADTENHAVRRYRPETGRIELLAGTGTRGSAGVGGHPYHVELTQPHGVILDRDGRIYISDSGNHRILRIEEAPSKNILVEENLTYGSAGGTDLILDLARPKDDETHPAIVFIHGGGWHRGSRQDYRDDIEEAARRGYVAVTVSYRLMEFDERQKETTTATPIFPAQIHDAKAAVRWLRAYAEKYRVDPDRIGVTGQSAGGHLSLLVGLTDADSNLEGESGTPNESSRVQAVVNVFGPTDIAGCYANSSVTWIFRLFMGGTPEEAPERYRTASPVTFVTKDDPPVLTLHGAKDQLVPLRQAELLDEAMKAAGAPHTLTIFENQGHGFDKEHKEHANRAMWDFFDRHLQRDRRKAAGGAE